MNKYSKIKKIFFSGIGGSGMSGIAEVLHNMGFDVSGSDIAESDSVKRMKRMGIDIALGHDGNNVKGIETLVYSSAISQDNVEVVAAKKAKVPVIPRAEMLAELMRLKFSVAIAGTHGKTSTTSMVASIFNEAGTDPTYVVGGKLKTEESGAKLGKSEYLIAEADESDGSFLQLYPTVAVITNIEDDHLDYYGSMDNLLDAFAKFGNKIPFYGAVIVNANCHHAKRILPSLNKTVVTFGFEKTADIRAVNIRQSTFKSEFDLYIKGKKSGSIELNTCGTHNIENALAAIAAAFEVGIDLKKIRLGLKRFYLPQRRFQVLYYDKSYLVIDDYAHHPTEVKATIEALQHGEFKRIITVFQPHRFSRLSILMEGFTHAFSGVDKLIVSKLYSANQSAIDEVNGETLANKIAETGFKDVSYMEDLEAIPDALSKMIKKGDAVVFLSAGNLSNFAHRFAEQLEGGKRTQ